METTTQDFDTALNTFMLAVSADIKKYAESFDADHMNYSDVVGEGYFGPVYLAGGRKYIRLATKSSGSGSVYCFVNASTGAILKAAGWKTPAKGERGNVFDTATYKGKGLHSSGWLYR